MPEPSNVLPLGTPEARRISAARPALEALFGSYRQALAGPRWRAYLEAMGDLPYDPQDIAAGCKRVLLFGTTANLPPIGSITEAAAQAARKRRGGHS